MPSLPRTYIWEWRGVKLRKKINGKPIHKHVHPQLPKECQVTSNQEENWTMYTNKLLARSMYVGNISSQLRKHGSSLKCLICKTLKVRSWWLLASLPHELLLIRTGGLLVFIWQWKHIWIICEWRVGLGEKNTICLMATRRWYVKCVFLLMQYVVPPSPQTCIVIETAPSNRIASLLVSMNENLQKPPYHNALSPPIFFRIVRENMKPLCHLNFVVNMPIYRLPCPT